MEFKNDDDPLTAAIDYWLNGNVEGVSISWSSIVTALKSSHVGEIGLANKIKKKHCLEGEEGIVGETLSEPHISVSV